MVLRQSTLASLGVLLLCGKVALLTTSNRKISPLSQIARPILRQTRHLALEDSKGPKTSTYTAFQIDTDLTAAAKHPDRSTLITLEYLPHHGESMPFLLPQNAVNWCMPPSFQALDYQKCDLRKPLNRVPTIGGMTNALKFVLLGAIASYEEGRCFYIDETDSPLTLKRGDKNHSLIKRYFEPIGLNPDSTIVQQALLEGRVETKDWRREKRRLLSSQHYIPYLENRQVDGHRLKFVTLMKVWRPLPFVRHAACSSLEQHGLQDDYLALSVRRGDKRFQEKFVYPTADEYMEAAERAIPHRFGGKVPKIFVATDDCSVMGEFRSLRPNWTFVSPCDRVQHAGDHGFVLAAMKDWSEQEMDRHYEKFMTELFGLAIAKHVIGVTYTNVSWWVFFMRGADVGSMEFVDDRNIKGFLSW